MLSIEYTQKSRENFIALLDAFPLQALNRIPEGFNNNLIWNFGHVIVTQQLLCYKLSGLEMQVSDEQVQVYRKGSKPERAVSDNEVQELKRLGLMTIDQLRRDLEKDVFQDFHEYTTSFGVTLSSIEEAIHFNSMHETLHLGYAMAMRKSL
jgi:hypothetical protein